VTAHPADEAPHAPQSQPGWSDAWQLDAANADGVGLTLRLECYPNEKVAWFWTYLVVPDRDGPIVVRDHEVALPRQGLEIRAEGLWADLWCETPLEHWTYGLEAFAVALDDAEAALTGEIGERLPIGLDIEWETDGPIHGVPDDWPIDQYAAPGIIHGDVLLGRERFALDARGHYTRSWGVRRWQDPGAWSLACHGADLNLYAEGLPDGRVDGWMQRRGGAGASVPITRARREAGDTALRFVFDDDVEVQAEVLTGAPVPVTEATVLDRALCRLQLDDVAANGWSSILEMR
jgi:hypothetical protein